jgi:hypothetical protein
MDGLVRAAVLNLHDLAADALRELEAFPTDATPEEAAVRLMLIAEAKAILHDREGFEEAKKKAIGQ